MTEKEKMLAGQIYDANYDKNLVEERQKAKELCFKYNMLNPSDTIDRENVLKELIGKIKGNILIEQPFICDYGYNIEMGDNFYSNHNLVILDAGGVKFGDNVFIGPNCGIYTSGHPIEKDVRNIGLEYAYPIKIGNDVWIGGNVCIFPGVTIGNNVVIGAGTVVNKNVPDNVVIAGNPFKIIKEIN